jgi:hypothetical protein
MGLKCWNILCICRYKKKIILPSINVKNMLMKDILTEYMCHKWPRTCSVWRNHNPVLFVFMTYQRVHVCNNCYRYSYNYMDIIFIVNFQNVFGILNYKLIKFGCIRSRKSQNRALFINKTMQCPQWDSIPEYLAL